MDSETLKHRLRCLGWKVRELGAQNSERWALLVTSCGHTIFATGNTYYDALSAACSTAMKLTLTGVRPGSFFNSGPYHARQPGGGRFLHAGVKMNDEPEIERLKEEYERLQARARRLFRQWEEIDRRMLEIERAFPDDEQFPGDLGKDSYS
jgi:hypothetical protein